MSDNAAKLMLKAVRSLPQDEQDEVFEHLLGAGLQTASSQVPNVSYATAPHLRMATAAHISQLFGPQLASATGPDDRLKVLPVRLPNADYDRLREWSREQGFSMAVVIRALLERFLDEQGVRPGQAST
ncbi:MAG: hypothetical protein M3313_03990 [Actinomycetota bacterium]|nr:hypothetical protein [Actinomycetota bacterium]